MTIIIIILVPEGDNKHEIDFITTAIFRCKVGHIVATSHSQHQAYSVHMTMSASSCPGWYCTAPAGFG